MGPLVGSPTESLIACARLSGVMRSPCRFFVRVLRPCMRTRLGRVLRLALGTGAVGLRLFRLLSGCSGFPGLRCNSYWLRERERPPLWVATWMTILAYCNAHSVFYQ
jgi:hypothetical protein